MPTEELKDFIEERLAAFDPDIDLSEGSPAQVQVVDPIVNRFTPDPFEMDVEKFIEARLIQEFPDVNFREGSGVRDLLVKANQLLLDPIAREVTLIKQGQSLANPELLAASEADALVANLFVSRATGGLATGTVRLYFNAPVALNISVGNACYTAGGLRFLPTSLQSISAEAMVFNQSGSLYYFDIQVTAEESGTDYNVGAGEVVGITNLNTAVRVANLDAFDGGLDEETTDELVEKAETSITERSLVVARGVSARLRDQFGALTHLQVVGHSDPEMGRDVITGGDLGPVLLSGSDGYTEDDGDGDATTPYFKVRYGEAAQDPFQSFFGSSGDLEDEYYITVSQAVWGTDAEIPVSDLNHIVINDVGFTGFVPEDVGKMIVLIDAGASNAGTAVITGVSTSNEVEIDRAGVVESGMTWMLVRPPLDMQIESVEGARELKLTEELPVDLPGLIWSVRKKEITISDIPGGIVFSDDAAAISLKAGEIHIGGATDFYVRGTSVEEAELVLLAVSDESPLITGDGMVGLAAQDEWVYVPGKNWESLGVRVGQSLIIESGNNAGTRTIIRVGVPPTGGAGEDHEYLQFDTPITADDPDMRYKIVDDIDIDLRSPRTLRGTGTDLQTVQLSQQVTTASAVDFLALGVEVDDTLEIIEGPDEGTYSVVEITGIGNKNITLGADMAATSNNVRWELYKAYDGMEFPLVRIRSVDILDSSQQPTGDTVPYAVPVDSRSSAFSNAGRGTKVSANDIIVGIVGTVDLGGLSYPLAATTINVEVNGSSVPIVLDGATNTNDLLNKINAEVPNIAGTLDIDGETRLTIRSGDRWLRMAAGDNATVGLAAGDDNRQIKSAAEVSDWTVPLYDLQEMRDVVYLKTGSPGYYYLVSVEAGRLLIISADEEDGRIRFPDPATSVQLVAGSRSYGKARVYFLEPTSFEVHGSWRPSLRNSTDYPANVAWTASGQAIAVDEPPRTIFTTTVNGSSLRFIPDPDLNRQVLPSSTEDTPNNLTSDGTTTVASEASPSGTLGQGSRDSAIDFLLREAQAGDRLEVTYQPIQGTVDVRQDPAGAIDYTDSPHPLNGKTLTLILENAPAKTITLSDQITSPDDLVDAINRDFGETLAYLEVISAAKYLRLEADFALTIVGSGTANSVLGLPVVTTNNYADGKGTYTVSYVGDSTDPTEHSKLECSAVVAVGQSQHFILTRPGNQRLHSTSMNSNLENGLYYMDVELVSEGVGDNWNLDTDAVFDMEGYESDGYRLVVADSNLTYSTEEELTMSLSRRVLTVGATDRPDQATPLSSQNLQVNYDRSPLTSSIQSFASADLERVLCASILVRHLQPHYLNFELTYRGGSSAAVVEDDVLDHLADLGPSERVEVSDIINIAYRRSADFVESPLELVAVAHDADRTITVDRSKNYVTRGRLSTFFSDNVVVTRELEGAF